MDILQIPALSSGLENNLRKFESLTAAVRDLEYSISELTKELDGKRETLKKTVDSVFESLKFEFGEIIIPRTKHVICAKKDTYTGSKLLYIKEYYNG